MTSHHKHLFEVAQLAIADVFSDRSVGLETTLESIEELQALCDLKIYCLKSDIRNLGQREGGRKDQEINGSGEVIPQAGEEEGGKDGRNNPVDQR